MKEELEVGSVVKLKHYCMGNHIGSVGIVFEVYQDFDDKSAHGVQVIFPNGENCGWGANEIDRSFEIVSVEPAEKHASYVWENAPKLMRDFRAGYWDFKAVA
jgi:hypothetical protein